MKAASKCFALALTLVFLCVAIICFPSSVSAELVPYLAEHFPPGDEAVPNSPAGECLYYDYQGLKYEPDDGSTPGDKSIIVSHEEGLALSGTKKIFEN